MSDATRTYIYALIRPGDAIVDAVGHDGAPVRTTRRDGIAAVVSTVAAESFDPATADTRMHDLAWLESTARTHDAVVSAAAQVATTIPLRLGTTADDDHSVYELLGKLGAAALRSFDRLDRHVEFGVQVFARPARSSPAPGSETGAAFLRRRQAELQQDETQRVEQAARAQGTFDALRALATAAKQNPLRAAADTEERSPMLLNAAFLVDVDTVTVFRKAVDELAASMAPDRVVITGPWAPYSFAELEL
jgi:hypothetical protein